MTFWIRLPSPFTVLKVVMLLHFTLLLPVRTILKLLRRTSTHLAKPSRRTLLSRAFWKTPLFLVLPSWMALVMLPRRLVSPVNWPTTCSKFWPKMVVWTPLTRWLKPTVNWWVLTVMNYHSLLLQPRWVYIYKAPKLITNSCDIIALGKGCFEQDCWFPSKEQPCWRQEAPCFQQG